MVMEYQSNWFTRGQPVPPGPHPYKETFILDAYYVTISGDLVGLQPPGDSIHTDESLAGTTVRVCGPFLSYNPTTKVVMAADGRQVQLLNPEKSKTLNERTKAWLKTLTS
jgi:hypothetical protein